MVSEDFCRRDRSRSVRETLAREGCVAGCFRVGNIRCIELKERTRMGPSHKSAVGFPQGFAGAYFRLGLLQNVEH